MDQHCSVQASSLLDEAHHCVDDALISDGLGHCFAPIEGEEAHALDYCIVLAVTAGTIYNMGDVVEAEPLDILRGECATCAMISSPINIKSHTLTGIDPSSPKLSLLLSTF